MTIKERKERKERWRIWRLVFDQFNIESWAAQQCMGWVSAQSQADNELAYYGTPNRVFIGVREVG